MAETVCPWSVVVVAEQSWVWVSGPLSVSPVYMRANSVGTARGSERILMRAAFVVGDSYGGGGPSTFSLVPSAEH